MTYNAPAVLINKVNSVELKDFVDCYQSAISENDFFADMKEKYNEIEKLFENSDPKASFSYECLYSGLHISYNEHQNYFCESVIKSPLTTYYYKQYIDGKLNFNEGLTYNTYDYIGGSGGIKFDSFGTIYSISELIQKSIIMSDNVAYQMLSRNISHDDIKSYWYSLGAETFWKDGLWGQINSHDGAIYMKELYRLTNDNPEIKDELLDLYFKSVMRLISLDDPNIRIVHKSGNNSSIVHDLAIIYNEQPYVLAITTRKGYDDYEKFFKEATKLINEFHEMYWDKKSNYCYNKVFSK